MRINETTKNIIWLLFHSCVYKKVNSEYSLNWYRINNEWKRCRIRIENVSDCKCFEMVNVTYDKRFFCRNYIFVAHESEICVFKIVFENLLMHSILSIWIHLPTDKTRYTNIQTLIKFRLGGVCTKDMRIRIIKMLTEWIKPTLTNGKGVDGGCNSGEHRWNFHRVDKNTRWNGNKFSSVIQMYSMYWNVYRENLQ